MVRPEISAHAHGTVTPAEPDDRIEYDRTHDELQQQGDDDESDEGPGNG